MRILLVEDFKPYRSLIAALLLENAGADLIGEAKDGLEAIEQAQQLKPDIIFMDIGLPKINGLEAARRIRKLVPTSKIIFLTQETNMVEEALSLGAWGYVSKQQAEADLLVALTAILQGNRFVSDGLGIDGFSPRTSDEASYA